MQQKAFDPFRGDEAAPGPAIATDAGIDGFVRDKAESAYHPSCTCRMGNGRHGRRRRQRAGCMASKGCASSMRRSCPMS